jgi:NAD(P)-dependent dehydrogenase (short-subunit alcohol dehydrogenase family)
MVDDAALVVVGGTVGLGLELARHYARRGRPVVLTGRDGERTAAAAAALGEKAVGVLLDLTRPHEIATALAAVGPVGHLALVAIDRDQNTVRDFAVDSALGLVTLKLVGYLEVIHALLDRLTPDASILLFGGLAKDRPYPGSVTVTTVNGGVVGMLNALVTELAPMRVNAIHPGIVGDSPYWSGKPAAVLEAFRSRTPTGRLATMADVVAASVFLLENRSVNGMNLRVDGGTLLG